MEPITIHHFEVSAALGCGSGGEEVIIPHPRYTNCCSEECLLENCVSDPTECRFWCQQFDDVRLQQKLFATTEDRYGVFERCSECKKVKR